MLEPLPNYDNWKTEPDDFDGYDQWADDIDRRFDEQRDAELQMEGEAPR